MAASWQFWKRTSRPTEPVASQVARPAVEQLPVIEFPVPVLWLVGKTGSGKTSIIRYLTQSTTAQIGNGFRPQTKTTSRYDFPDEQSPLLTFLDTRGIGEAGYDHTADIHELAEAAHLMLLVVRVMDHAQAETVAILEQIHREHPKLPVLLVLTNLHEAYPGEDHPQAMVASATSLNPGVDTPWPTPLARSIEQQLVTFGKFIQGHATIDFTQPDDGFSVEFLGGEELTFDLCSLLPAAAMTQLSQMQRFTRIKAGLPADLDVKIRRYLWAYSSAAAVAGAVPVPWVDLPAVVGLQAAMAWQLSLLYRYDYSGSRIGQLVSAVSGQMIARQGIRELLKFIPYVGSVASSALAFATTYGLGQTIVWAIERERLGQLPSAAEFRDHLAKQASLAQNVWKSRSKS